MRSDHAQDQKGFYNFKLDQQDNNIDLRTTVRTTSIAYDKLETSSLRAVTTTTTFTSGLYPSGYPAYYDQISGSNRIDLDPRTVIHELYNVASTSTNVYYIYSALRPSSNSNFNTYMTSRKTQTAPYTSI